MNRSNHGARRLLALDARWLWAVFATAACGGAGNEDLLKPQSAGGQASSARGGSAGEATASGGVSTGGAGSEPGGQAGSDSDAGSAGASATGGDETGGVGGVATGGVGGKATPTTGGVGGAATGGEGGKATIGTGGAGGGAAGGLGGKATMGGAGGKASTGGVGGAASGGVGGKATTGGAGGKSTGGAGGSAATCPGKCDANADCKAAAGAVTCTCRSGFVGNGQTCARPISCLELHTSEPTLESGAYPLQPARATSEITTYCEMTAEGGGWTLVLNGGPTFDPSAQGRAAAQCYRQDCTNLAYSTVPVGTDVMLDVRDTSIVAANYLARVIVTGVEARTRGKTVRELFTSGPYYLEKQDNTNLTVRLMGARACSEQLPSDFGAMVCNSCAAGASCDAPVIVFGDVDPGCVDDPMFAFAIGGASTYTTPWGNCAGWPQDPKHGGTDFYPNNFRVWVR